MFRRSVFCERSHYPSEAKLHEISQAVDHLSKEKRWQVVDGARKRTHANVNSLGSSSNFPKNRELCRSNQKFRNPIFKQDVHLRSNQNNQVLQREHGSKRNFYHFSQSLVTRRHHPTLGNINTAQHYAETAHFRSSKSPSRCLYRHDRNTAGLMRRSLLPSPEYTRSCFNSHNHQFNEPIEHHGNRKLDYRYQSTRNNCFKNVVIKRHISPERRQHSTTCALNVDSRSFLSYGSRLSYRSTRSSSDLHCNKFSRLPSLSREKRSTRSSFSPPSRRSTRSSSRLHIREYSHTSRLSTSLAFRRQMNKSVRCKRDFDRFVKNTKSREDRQCRRQSSYRSSHGKNSGNTSPKMISLNDESARNSCDDLKEYEYDKVLIDDADGACVEIPRYASNEGDEDKQSQHEDDSSVTSEISYATATDAEIYMELYDKEQSKIKQKDNEKLYQTFLSTSELSTTTLKKRARSLSPNFLFQVKRKKQQELSKTAKHAASTKNISISLPNSLTNSGFIYMSNSFPKITTDNHFTKNNRNAGSCTRKRRSRSFSLKATLSLVPINTNITSKQRSKSMEIVVSKSEVQESLVNLKRNLFMDMQINNIEKELFGIRSTLILSETMSPLTAITKLRKCNSSPSVHVVDVGDELESATADKVMAKSVSMTDLSKVWSTEKQNFKGFNVETRNSSIMQLNKEDYSECKLRSRKRCLSLPPLANDFNVGKPTTNASQSVMPSNDVKFNASLVAENDISKAVSCLIRV